VINQCRKPVDRDTSNTDGIDPAQTHGAAERIRVRAAKLKAGFDWEDLKSDRDTDRP
jgi:hypothetical protein